MAHELKEIRYQSRTYAKLETLMNRVNEESIKEAHRRQVQNKAVGVDGVTKAEYGKELDENTADLIKRMKRFSYKPQPVRRAYIPLNPDAATVGISILLKVPVDCRFLFAPLAKAGT